MSDNGLRAVSERVLALHAQMTLDEKLAQLVGYWVDQGDEVVAPMAGEMVTSTRYEDATANGIGHLEVARPWPCYRQRAPHSERNA